MARDDAQVNHRMSYALKSMIESAAKANKRSVTAEINARLEGSFAGDQPTQINLGGESPIPVLLSLDQKLSALCTHLGVRVDVKGSL